MKINRPLIFAGYLTAIGLILAPGVETLVSIWPFQLGAVSWRFGAAGLISRGLITSLLGILVAGGIAVSQGHRRVVFTLSALCGFLALSLLGLFALLLLDAVQLRATVNAQAKASYDLAATGALLRVFLVGMITVLLAWGGFAAAGSGNDGKERKAGASKLALKPTSPPATGRDES